MRKVLLASLLLSNISFADDACESAVGQSPSVRALQIAEQASVEFSNFNAPVRGRPTGQIINKNGFYQSLATGAEGEFTRSLTGYTVNQVYSYWRTLDEVLPKENGLSNLAYPTYENADGAQSSYTGPHGEDYFPSLAGREFRDWDPDTQGRLRLAFVDYAWSAAFISSTLYRGAQFINSLEFTYSMNHRDYINEAIRQSEIENSTYAFRACDPFRTRARVGDMICYIGVRASDGSAVNYTFSRLKSEVLEGSAPRYGAHCDVVVARNNDFQLDSTLETIGGNVGNAVTRRFLQLTYNGRLERMYRNAPPIERTLRPNDQNWVVLLQAK